MAKLLVLLLGFYAASCNQLRRSYDYPGVYDSWSGRFYPVPPYPSNPFIREPAYHRDRLSFNPEYRQFNSYQEPNKEFNHKLESSVPAEAPVKTDEDPVSEKADDIIIYWPPNHNIVDKPKNNEGHHSESRQQVFNDTQGRFLGGFGSFFTLPERFRANSVQLLNNVPVGSTLTFLSTVLTSTTVRVPQVCLTTPAGMGVCRRRRGIPENEPDFVEVEGKQVRPSEVVRLIPTAKPQMIDFVEDQQRSGELVHNAQLVESSKTETDLEVSSRAGRTVKEIYDAQVVYTVTSLLTVTQTFSLTAGSLVKVSLTSSCVPSCLLTIPNCPA